MFGRIARIIKLKASEHRLQRHFCFHSSLGSRKLKVLYCRYAGPYTLQVLRFGSTNCRCVDNHNSSRFGGFPNGGCYAFLRSSARDMLVTVAHHWDTRPALRREQQQGVPTSPYRWISYFQLPAYIDNERKLNSAPCVGKGLGQVAFIIADSNAGPA